MNLFFTLPLIPLVGGVLTLIYHFRNQSTNLLTNVFILISFLLSILLIGLVGHRINLEFHFMNLMGNELLIKLQIDNLSIIMLLLINFVSLIIHRYATSYLASDITQGRFMAQLSILTGAVSLLVISGNLFTAFLGWQFVGLSLYLLLNHYHYDTHSNKAAKKEFVINRIGDFCFLIAVILCYHFYGNSDFQIITNNSTPAQINTILGSFSANTVIVLLIFIAVMTKSAQFPFHIWLPDTMQAPTPVSAIMHAGVINSGGFLLTRISPLISLSPFSSDVIFTIGIISVVTASFFMLSQSDVKKQLAYSTMGQMGYMVMQCGLGLYTAAIFHLVAHGFFKAFLFLSAGNNIRLKPSKRETIISKSIFSIIFSCLLIVSYYLYTHQLAYTTSAIFITIIFISITIAQILAEIITLKNTPVMKLVTALIVIGLFTLYFILLDTTENYLTFYRHYNDNNLDYYKLGLGLIMLLLQIIVWAAPFYAKILSPRHILYIYHLSRNKLFIEEGYRKFLLGPYRRFGDYLNSLFNRFNLAFFAIIGLVSLTYTYFGITHKGHFDNSYNVVINQIIYIFILIAANRSLNIGRLNFFLFISQINLVNMGLFTPGLIRADIVLFQIINAALVFSAIHLILRSRGRPAKARANANLLSLNSSYFAILLFLLIGLPGTASFISELNILLSLATDNFNFIILAGLGFILLAIAIMHALQEHVFNLDSAFLPKNIYLTSYEQLFIIFCIAVNVYNGVKPEWMLDKLEWFLR